VKFMHLIRRVLPVLDDFRQMTFSPKSDLIAGLSVAVVALPLALAFGVSSGVGAAAGLTTAIVAGFAAAIFGGSRIQVSGPTGAMTVVLIPVAAKFGVAAVFAVGFMAGIILIVMAITGSAKAMRYIPPSVIEGFTVGIALLIGLQQIPMALGIRADSTSVVFGAMQSAKSWISNPEFGSLAIALATTIFILVMAKSRPKFPAGITTVFVATALIMKFDWGVSTVGQIPASLNWVGLPSITGLPLVQLIIPALSIASLAAIEGLLCASVADSMAQLTQHNPHQELFGQGIANLLAPLFGGVPATAAIARTAVNVRSGAQSRLASASHSVILLICVWVASDYVSNIPLAALAGVLIATSIKMVDRKKLSAFIKETPHHLIIVPITAIATLFLDLVEAVAAGLIVAFALTAIQNYRNPLPNALENAEIDQALEHLIHPEEIN